MFALAASARMSLGMPRTLRLPFFAPLGRPAFGRHPPRIVCSYLLVAFESKNQRGESKLRVTAAPVDITRRKNLLSPPDLCTAAARRGALLVAPRRARSLYLIR